MIPEDFNTDEGKKHYALLMLGDNNSAEWQDWYNNTFKKTDYYHTKSMAKLFDAWQRSPAHFGRTTKFSPWINGAEEKEWYKKVYGDEEWPSWAPKK